MAVQCCYLSLSDKHPIRSAQHLVLIETRPSFVSYVTFLQYSQYMPIPTRSVLLSKTLISGTQLLIKTQGRPIEAFQTWLHERGSPERGEEVWLSPFTFCLMIAGFDICLVTWEALWLDVSQSKTIRSIQDKGGGHNCSCQIDLLVSINWRVKVTKRERGGLRKVSDLCQKTFF